MKEQQVINKLRLLKTMQPAKPVLKDIKQSVYQQMKVEYKTQTFGIQERFDSIFVLIKSYNVAFYSVSVALLLILFLSASSVFFSNQVHNIILDSKLAVASNQYQRASIALADTTSRFGENMPVEQHTQELSQSLALTNAELNSLKLKGEKGQYTAQECHQIYQTYLNYLEKKEKSVFANNPPLLLVKSQMDMYEEQAEQKLNMYKSL